MTEFLMALTILLFGSGISAAKTPSYVESIRQITCSVDPTKIKVGTGNVIGQDRILTAFHVVSGKGACEFNDRPITKVIYANADEDIAVLEVETGFLPILPTTCTGFKTGVQYMAFGYPGFLERDAWRPRIRIEGTFPNSKFIVEQVRVARPVLAANILTALATFKDFAPTPNDPITSHHLRMMQGSVFPGMSGGAIMDGLGFITGVITATNGVNSSNRDLAETGLCRK